MSAADVDSRYSSLINNIPVVKQAAKRLQDQLDEIPVGEISSLVSGRYRGSRGVGAVREDVEYNIQIGSNGSVNGLVTTSNSTYRVHGCYNNKQDRYLWGEAPLSSDYCELVDTNAYINHVASLALLNDSSLTKDGAVHVEVSLKVVLSQSGAVSLVGTYQRSDQVSGDQRLVFMDNGCEENMLHRRNTATSLHSTFPQFHSNFNPFDDIPVVKKAIQSRFEFEESNRVHGQVMGRPSNVKWGRYRGSRSCPEGRLDTHYCLAFSNGAVMGCMMKSGAVFKVQGWYRSNRFVWAEIPIDMDYSSFQHLQYWGLLSSMTLFHGSPMLQGNPVHTEVSMKLPNRDSVCLIGDFSSSDSSSGDQRLIFIEEILDSDQALLMTYVPYNGSNSHLIQIPVAKKAMLRMSTLKARRQGNRGLVNVHAPWVPSGRFCGSRSEGAGRVNVTYYLTFLEGGLLKGTMKIGEKEFDVKGWFNPVEGKFEWGESPVGAGCTHIEDVEEYTREVALRFLFPGAFPGGDIHTEVTVSLLDMDTTCLIGEFTRGDGTIGDLRLVATNSSSAPPERISQWRRFAVPQASVDFESSKFEPLLEKETLKLR